MKGFFVTGTDTEVGKTVVAAGLVHALAAQGLRVAGMKPVASGGRETPAGLRNEDAETLIAAANVAADYAEVNPYCFAPPIAPHLAAAEAGVVIEAERILAIAKTLASRSDAIIVEGVGGWRVPLAPDFDLATLAAALGLPVVLVVGLRLGCLNHALLSAESISRSGCAFAGWIGSAVDARMARRDENVAVLRERLAAPCLGLVPHLDGPTPAVAAAHLDAAALTALLLDEAMVVAHEYKGACHCGAITVVYRTVRDPAVWPLHACQCAFCRAHGAVTSSDPAGSLSIAARRGALCRYRFGLRTADFLLCAHCGTYVAAVAEIGGHVYATLNVNVLECRGQLQRETRPVDYAGESAEGRRERRRRNWTPLAELVEDLRE